MSTRAIRRIAIAVKRNRAVLLVLSRSRISLYFREHNGHPANFVHISRHDTRLSIVAELPFEAQILNIDANVKLLDVS